MATAPDIYSLAIQRAVRNGTSIADEYAQISLTRRRQDEGADVATITEEQVGRGMIPDVSKVMDPVEPPPPPPPPKRDPNEPIDYMGEFLGSAADAPKQIIDTAGDVVEGVGEAVEGVKRGWAGTMATMREDRAQFERTMGRGGRENDHEITRNRIMARMEQAATPDSAYAEFGSSVGMIAGSLYSMGEKAIEAAAAGAAVGAAGGAVGGAPGGPIGSAGGAVVGAVGGAATGLAVGFLADSYKVNAGSIMSELNDFRGPNGETIGPEAKKTAGMAGGLAMAALDAVGVGILLKPFTRKVKEEVVRHVARRVATAYATTAIGESGVEVVQEGVSAMSVDLAKAATDPGFETLFNSPKRRAEVLDRLADTFITTIQGMSVVALPGAGVAGYKQNRANAKITDARLTPEDRASPLSDEDIGKGKTAVAEALDEMDAEDADPTPIQRAPTKSVPAPKAKPIERMVEPERTVDGRNARQVLKGKIRQVESGGRDSAKNTLSSASGRYQFIDSTFDTYYKRVFGTALTAQQREAVKNNPAIQERLMDALIADNEAALRRAGFAPTAGNLYLAHFLGSAGAKKALSNPNGQLDAAVAKANPTLAGRTNGEVANWAAKKMGGKAAVFDGDFNETIDYDDAAYEARVKERQAREDVAQAAAFAEIAKAAEPTPEKADEVRERLDEKQAANPAEQLLQQEGEAAEAVATEGGQENEVPIYQQDEGQEWPGRQVAWENTQTGAQRPFQSAPVGPATTSAAVGQSDPAATTASQNEATASAPPIPSDSTVQEPTQAAFVATAGLAKVGETTSYAAPDGSTITATVRGYERVEGKTYYEVQPEGSPTTTFIPADSTEVGGETASAVVPATEASALGSQPDLLGGPTLNTETMDARRAAPTIVATAIEENDGDIEGLRDAVSYVLNPTATEPSDVAEGIRQLSTETGVTFAGQPEAQAYAAALQDELAAQGYAPPEGVASPEISADAALRPAEDAASALSPMARAEAPAAAPPIEQSGPTQKPATARVPAKGKRTAKTPAPVAGAALKPIDALVARAEAKRRTAAKDKIDRRVERIDETLTNHGYENEKGPLRATLKRLVKQGVLEQAEVDAVAPYFKDRDMGAEDIVSEIEGSVRDWGDRQKAAVGAEGSPKQPVVISRKEQKDGGREADRPAGGVEATAQPVQDDRGLRGEPRVLERTAGQDARDAEPLEGAPAATVEVDGAKVAIKPSAIARQAARAYAKVSGLVASRPRAYVKVDKALAKRIADAYEAMADAPNDPEVRASYEAMARETIAQWEVIKLTGLKVEFINYAANGDPYSATPRLAQADVAQNNHLWVFNTEDGYGQEGVPADATSPMLEFAPGEVISGRPVRVNDIFRIVHDYFGHIKDGNGFRATGEENAWQSHAAMYSPLARRAMTSETRGQNSWVNFGPFGDANRTASSGATVYAEQKIGLLPEWASSEGMVAVPEQTPVEIGRKEQRNEEAQPQVTAAPERPTAAERSGRGGGLSAPSDPAVDAGPSARLTAPPVDADGNIALDHFGIQAGVTETDPSQWGRSGRFLPREESQRIGLAPGRTYFGIGTGQPGGYVNEFRSGVHPRTLGPVFPYKAKVPLDRLYDMDGDPLGLKAKGRALPKNASGRYEYNGLSLSSAFPGVDSVSLYELLIKDAGYAGYWTDSSIGMVAAVFEAVPVTSSVATSISTRQQQPNAASEFTERLIEGSATPSQPAPVATLAARPIPGPASRAAAMAEREAAFEKVIAVVRSMGLAGRFGVEVRAQLEGGAWGEFASYADGSLIISAAFLGNPNIALTARHEIIHWMREAGVIDKSEWSALVAWAKTQPEAMKWARDHYAGAEDYILEEAVAEGVARLLSGRAGAKPKGLVATAIAKIQKFIKAIRQAMSKTGLTELQFAELIIDRIESGKQIKISDKRGADLATRHKRLREALISGLITPQQHWFLTTNPVIKYQSAWHGAPADNIEKFDLSFIGMGEGGQAFGWGLYFAKLKDIAAHYRAKLTTALTRPDEAVMIDGMTMKERFTLDGAEDNWGSYAVASDVANFLDGTKPYNGWLEALRNKALNEYDKATAMGAAFPEGEPDRVGAIYNELIASEMRGQKVSLRPAKKGALFKVEIPENEDLLDLDKTLGEQSDKVKAGLQKLHDALPEDVREEYEEQLNDGFWGWTGRELQLKVLPRMAYDDAFPGNVPEDVERALEDGAGDRAGSLYLKSLGIPGNRYLDANSRGQPDGSSLSHNFVLFDDSLVVITSKERRRTNLDDPGEPDPTLMGKIGDVTTTLATGLRSQRGEAGGAFDRWRTMLQDKMLPLLRVQIKVEGWLGRALTDEENPYVRETLYSSRVGDQLARLTDDLIEPLTDDLYASGISVDELDAYLYARHAPERNAQIHARNPNFGPDEGSGMTNAEAAQIMADVAASGGQAEFDALAARVAAIVEFSIQVRENAGLLSQAEANTLRTTYANYVPLRGHEEMDPTGAGSKARTGRGINVVGGETRTAFGRESRASDLLTHTIMQAEEAIVRAEKNLVGQAFGNMVKEHPEPGFWKIDPTVSVRTIDPKTGLVATTTRPLTADEKDRTVSYKENGQETRVLLDPDGNNPTAARLARSMRNLGPQQMGEVTAAVAVVGRYLSMINTTYNPEFVISNAIRDLQTASLNLTQHDIKGLVKGTLADWVTMKPLLAAHKGERGTLGNALWDGWARDFAAAGGKVHFNQMDDIDALRNRLGTQLKRRGEGRFNLLRAARGFKKHIEDANGAVENAIRLSVFKNAVELGLTHQQAANIAKNVTVNFNRHGEFGPAVNAWYVFANASIQGSTIMLQALARSRKVRAAAMAMTVMGFALDALNQWLDDDDEDGQGFYSKIPEFEKSRNLILMAPWLGKGRYIKMPMTWGYNVFPTMGRLASEVASGRKSVVTAMGNAATSMIDAFNPIGGTNSLFNFALPSIVDPIHDIDVNRDFTNRPIRPEQPIRDADKEPMSQLAWPRTGNGWKSVAEMMNALGGGDDVTPSEWSVMDNSPETLKYISGVVAGAAGQFAGRLGGIAQHFASGGKVELGVSDIPMYRKVTGGKPNWHDQSAYYQRMRATEYAVDRLKRYRDDGNPEGEAWLREKEGDFLKPEVVAATKAARKEQKELNKEKRAINAAAKKDDMGGYTKLEIETMRADHKLKQEDLVLRYNTAWIAAIGDKREAPEE